MTEANGVVIDLFAGPGGWDLAATALGLRVVGIEFDKAACQTRRAAGLETIEDDVRSWSPAYWVRDENPLAGLIASPPCQTFSMAGKGAGRAALDLVLGLINVLAKREEIDSSLFEDERTALVLEPLRWALEAIDLGHPFPWLAFEQVPTVLPVWEAMAEVLRAEGYTVVTGKLTAEQYGVPQTRKRAILMARFGGDIALPAPTHRLYKKGIRQDEGDQSLLPWVSMAEALGWGMTQRPYPTIACSRSTGGPDKEKVGGSAARAVIYGERDAGRWVFMPTNDRPNVTKRNANEPAPTLAFGHERPRWVVKPELHIARSEAFLAENPRRDHPADEPCPTITGKFRSAEWRGGVRFGNQANSAVRSMDEPAATVRFGERLNTVEVLDENQQVVRQLTVEEAAAFQSFPAWPFERPATTVQCDPRIAKPGHRCMTTTCHPGQAPTSMMDGAIRVTEPEASVLQSFPWNYPWQGSRTKQFQQIGNAVPPVLAYAVLAKILNTKAGV